MKKESREREGERDGMRGWLVGVDEGRDGRDERTNGDRKRRQEGESEGGCRCREVCRETSRKRYYLDWKLWYRVV